MDKRLQIKPKVKPKPKIKIKRLKASDSTKGLSFTDKRYVKKMRKVNIKKAKQALPEARFRRERLDKTLARSHHLALVSAGISPIMNWINITGDDTEKIRLAEINAQIHESDNERDIQLAINKLKALQQAVEKRTGDKGPDLIKRKNGVQNSNQTGLNTIDTGFKDPNSIKRSVYDQIGPVKR